MTYITFSLYTLLWFAHLHAHALKGIYFLLLCFSLLLVGFWHQTYALFHHLSASSRIWWHWHITTVLTELSRCGLPGRLFTSLLYFSSASQQSLTIIGNHQERLRAYQDHHNTQYGKLSARTKRERKCQKLVCGMKVLILCVNNQGEEVLRLLIKPNVSNQP